ncbi:MAG TPA: DNA repair protein RecN [Chloroflexota bacterium]|nr:DNA repair protein RecN [Chloroflexota bacterium]
MQRPARLIELRIKDFAIVDELTIELEPGLNALTGETGAGKSILIDALGAVLGERVSPTMLRAGADRALVEATFTKPPELPAELDVGPDEDVLILSREITAARSAARINGRTVPVSLLQAAGQALVDIHGQSDHQSLFRPSTHLLLLDRFAGLEPQRRQLAGLVRQLRDTRRELADLQSNARELARQQDLLRFQLDEIDRAELQRDEEDELTSRRTVLANTAKLRQTAALALEAIDGEAQAIDAASLAAKHLADAARLDASLEPDATALEGAIDALRETSRALTRYVDGLDADPDELQRVEDRLDLIRNLERKYGDTVGDVLAFAENARQQLSTIETAGSRAADLAVEERRLEGEALAAAAALSGARRAVAPTLADAVQTELADLNMPSARFKADIQTSSEVGPRNSELGTRNPELTDTGTDTIQFLLSANPGEPPRALVQVASGGEASRLMLALKTVFSAADETPVLVFDEIESGVGARSGGVVGRKLRQLADHHQVLCITHLAPVAAQAAAHFKVAKHETDARTTTTVTRLDAAAREQELAEMIAGSPVTASALASARELLDAAS